MHETPLAGGDVSETPVPLADIVLMGSVPRGKAMLRSTARAGDLLYVTGTLGGGAAALPHFERLSRGGGKGLSAARIPKGLAPLLARHLYPQPRIAQGLVLRRKGLASAAMDMSDGLSSDLAHICEESGVAAEVEAALLPVHPGASVEYALHGGDDYELLFTARPGVRMPKAIGGVPITRIGRIVAKRRGRAAISVITERGTEPLLAEGWEHFR
jgi:thiamine-monophosphate kinase